MKRPIRPDQTSHPRERTTSALESKGLLDLVVTMREVLEVASPTSSTLEHGGEDAAAVDGVEKSGGCGGEDSSSSEAGVIRRLPVARWMQ